MAFTYRTEITTEHFVEFQALVWSKMKSQPEIRKWQGRVYLLLIVSMAVFIMFLVDFFRNEPLARQHALLVLTGIFLIAWSMALHWHHKYSMRQWAAQSHTIIGKETLTLSDDGIATVGVHCRGECSWDAVVDIIETDSMVAFMTDPTKGYLCPKEAIPEGEYDTLLAYARSRMAG